MPHVHFHIIPRHKADYADNDDIYPAMEQSEVQLKGDLEATSRSDGRNGPGKKWEVPQDQDRKPRTEGEMEKEARWLESFFNV